MRTLVESSRYWEMVVEVGNDWGMPSYVETNKYNTKEEVEEALKYMDYYSVPQQIKEVIEYDIEYR